MLTLTKDEIENSVYRNSDLKKTALELYDKLEKAEAELAEFKADIALLLDQKDDYQEKLFEENEALKADIAELRELVKWFFECEIFWDSDMIWDGLRGLLDGRKKAQRELLQSKRCACKDLRKLIKKR